MRVRRAALGGVLGNGAEQKGRARGEEERGRREEKEKRKRKMEKNGKRKEKGGEREIKRKRERGGVGASASALIAAAVGHAWCRSRVTRRPREKQGAGYGCRDKFFGNREIGIGRFPESWG